ncbi:MAG: DUF6364 family protein [Bacteroidota bacterium]
MQTKLTLRLDEELIREAKALARRRGTSVSKLVAGYFRALTQHPGEAPEEEPLPPLTRSLIGALAGAEVSEEDHHAYLEEKHQ